MYKRRKKNVFVSIFCPPFENKKEMETETSGKKETTAATATKENIEIYAAPQTNKTA